MHELDIGWVNIRGRSENGVSRINIKTVVRYQGGTQRAHDVKMTST